MALFGLDFTFLPACDCKANWMTGADFHLTGEAATTDHFSPDFANTAGKWRITKLPKEFHAPHHKPIEPLKISTA